jgi:hypothetical protein
MVLFKPIIYLNNGHELFVLRVALEQLLKDKDIEQLGMTHTTVRKLLLDLSEEE